MGQAVPGADRQAVSVRVLAVHPHRQVPKVPVEGIVGALTG